MRSKRDRGWGGDGADLVGPHGTVRALALTLSATEESLKGREDMNDLICLRF